MTLLLLSIFSPASASEHTDTLGDDNTIISAEDTCWINVVTATMDGTLTKVEGYVGENDSAASPTLIFQLTERTGADEWSRTTTLDTVTITGGSSDAWVGTDALDQAITAGKTYAIGWCTTYAVDNHFAAGGGAIPQPVWGTMDGYDSYRYGDSLPTEVREGMGLYMKVTFDAPDADRDGYDVIEDCDDADRQVSPDAAEIWYDGVDTNCDGADDYDQDGDSHLSDAFGGDDCDDTNAEIPSRTDTWYDGVDADCGGNSDYDQDGDGHDATDYGGADCDDEDGNLNPDATERWYDGVDQNCDGSSDFDQDGDGLDAQSAGGKDCDDTDAALLEDCSGGSDTEAPGGHGGKEDEGDEEEEGGCGGGGESALLLTGFLPALLKKRRVL